ncbi:NADH oxidase [Clostridium botulinum]|uniref:NADH oxidase n=2 Tax=Clostridium botulinum TaxID=1491 RepID=A0A846I3A1_CLOBO|nr:hypothetical protein [Clostridium botulinum]ACQ52825.1 exosporium protein J [Clostridium botulinum Ba4 str. 657]AJD26913.1 hypothetical protein T257_2289 [Clostridium botulinum CDC_297]EDT87184.1 NADH oxidase [Clostridium botulinum Bf]EPS49781.1 exosporium protein J [Clostridium botulinum A1 str. CFSAN002368]AJE11256.1 hypothetical protein T259_972 [Clostridium botulinum CDC_1436]
MNNRCKMMCMPCCGRCTCPRGATGPKGTTGASGIIAESIPVTAGEKILLFASTTTLGVDIASVVTGFVSAGIAIS